MSKIFRRYKFVALMVSVSFVCRRKVCAARRQFHFIKCICVLSYRNVCLMLAVIPFQHSSWITFFPSHLSSSLFSARRMCVCMSVFASFFFYSKPYISFIVCVHLLETYPTASYCYAMHRANVPSTEWFCWTGRHLYMCSKALIFQR